MHISTSFTDFSEFVLIYFYWNRRYAQLICSVITLQSGSGGPSGSSGSSADWGVGGGGENMMLQDVNVMRTEMIGE